MAQIIAPATTIGEISLLVSNLERSVRYYRDGLGFELLSREGDQAFLGAGGRQLIELVQKPGVKPRPQNGPASKITGLYHFAILLPDRRSLARLLVHLAESETEVAGAADHGVSEALYLTDPDGLGIELYSDRKRGEWPTDDLGKLQMGTEELDVDDLVMELKDGVPPWQGLPPKTTIGHVHLHVTNLAEAEAFYTQVLGLQLMQRYQSGAIFVSAGGYHHHVGLNTWAGVGAPPSPADIAGLRWFELLLPNKTELEAIQAHLNESTIPYETRDGGILVKDPSQNAIILKTM